MKNRAAPVAVFDSGAGGVGVLRELQKLLPWEDFLYFGDSANAPYGTRSEAEIRALVTAHAARLLLKERCKALVLACNTATAVAAAPLRAAYPDLPIIGMEPALRPALAVKKAPTVLILATTATLAGEKFARLCATLPSPDAHLLPIAADGIVPLVESDRANGAEIRAYLAAILAPLRGIRPDAAVLGCTHFPFAARAIREALPDVPLFDGTAGTARETARRLAALGLSATRPTCGNTVPFSAARPTHGVTVLTSSDPAALPLYRRLLWGKAEDAGDAGTISRGDPF